MATLIRKRYCWPDNPRRCANEAELMLEFKAPDVKVGKRIIEGAVHLTAVCVGHLSEYVKSEQNRGFILNKVTAARTDVNIWKLGSRFSPSEAVFLWIENNEI